MLDPRDPEVSVETTEGDRPRSSAGDRLMIGLAVLALVGGGLIGLSKLLPSEAAADASATPGPGESRGATTAPSEGTAALRTYTVTYSPPRDDVVLAQSATGWIRARRSMPIRSDPRNDATVSRQLRPGDAAFVVDNSPVDPTGWLEVVAPVTGWLPRSSVLGPDVDRFAEHPLDQPSAYPDQLVAGGDGQFLMGIWGANGDGYSLGVTSGGSWQRTDPPRGTDYVRAAFGPLGWIAFAISSQTERPRAWLWQSNDGRGWSSLGDASALFSVDQLAPIAVVGSPLGYVMTSSFYEEAGAHYVWFSADGLTWSERSVPLAAPALATTDIGFYAYTTNLSQQRVAAFSPNGDDWSEVDTTNLGQLVGVAGARDQFVALERVGSLWYSWTARDEGNELVWRRGSGSERAFDDAAVTGLSGDQVPIAVGWERSTEAPLWWSYDDAGWHRHRLPSSFRGLPRVAASSEAGFVVVGSGGGALGRDPVVWASGPSGDLQEERKPFLATDGTFDPEACAPYSGDLLDMLANQGIGYAECRRSEPFTVSGYVLPCDGCEQDAPSPPIAGARWLADPDEGRIIRLSPVESKDVPQWLEGVLRPGVAVNDRWVGHWVSVTGHFDDPEAQSCRMPPAAEEEPFYAGRAEVIARCRSRFVVTDVRVEP